MPLLLASRAAGAGVPICKQALIVLGASLICPKLRRRPVAELTGALTVRWPAEWLVGSEKKPQSSAGSLAPGHCERPNVPKLIFYRPGAEAIRAT